MMLRRNTMAREGKTVGYKSDSETSRRSPIKINKMGMTYKRKAVTYKRKGLWLIIPGLLGFSVFYIIPFIFSFYYSVIESAFNKRFVGLANFINVLQNRYYRLALKNTFRFTGIAVPLLVAISFILSLLLVKSVDRLKACRASFVIPMLLPTAAVVMIWRVLFGDDTPVMKQLAKMAESLHLGSIEMFPIYLFFIWKNAGYNMILFISAMSGIPQDILEASELDGAGTIKKNLYITLPLILPTTFFVIIISMVNSFKIFKEVYLFFDTSYPSEAVYIVQHYMNNHFYKLNYQNLATGAIIFALIIYVIVAMAYRLENKMNMGVW